MSNDLPEGLGPATPGLRVFLASLAGAATPDELTGEEATLAMFREIRPSAGTRTDRAIGAHRSRQEQARRPRHRSARALRTRLAAWLAAVTLSLCGGIAAAGYAAALPAPVQHVAHSLFGFAGLPDTAQAAHRGPAPRRSAPAPYRSRPVRPTPRSSSPAPSASASPPVPLTLSATMRSVLIPAGGKATITAALTSRGRAVPGAALSLLELAAGHPAWQVAAQATTSAAGWAVLVAASLTVNAKFRVTGPSGSASGQLTVVVVPVVSVSVTSSGGHGATSVLTASCPLAQLDDVAELQVLSGGQWRDVRAHRISRTGLAAFTLPASKHGGTFRVVLLATAYHGQSVSRALTVPGRGRSGQHGNHVSAGAGRGE